MPDDDSDESVLSGEVVSDAFDGPGDWLPAADAARRLRISERTLWRRVDAGKLQRRLVSGKAVILVPVAGTTPDSTDLAVPAAPDALTVAIIEELRRAREEDAERLTRQADDIRRQAEEIGRLQAERDQARETVERMQSYSWWKRLFGYN